MLKKFDAKPSECLAVGDDQTMIPVFRKVGLSIAFNPQSKEVEKCAKITVREKSLKAVLPWIASNL